MITLIKPTVGPIIKGCEKDLGKKSVNIWCRGNSNSEYSYIIARIRLCIYEHYNSVKVKKVYRNNDYTGIISFNNLIQDTKYYYQIGCSDQYGEIDWTNASSGTFRTDGKLKNWGFIFGSCRRLLKIGKFTLLGTGNRADRIFKSINNHHIDFFMSIGDQVYFDPMNSFLRKKSLQDMRKLYRTVKSYKYYKQLVANNPIYEMCDDHDIHKNDSCYTLKLMEQDVWDNGFKSYMEYQNIRGVSENKNLWYIFERKNATFFVFDTRSERNELKKEIISRNQMDSFKMWIRNPINKNKIKYLVSSVPLMSQKSMDSWYAFPDMQKEVFNTICGNDTNGNPIDKVIVLTGDAHCVRCAKYEVRDNGEKKSKYDILEILSSGLVAINHDKGKEFNSDIDISEYNINNDFPHTVDNSHKGGLTFITKKASKCYPENRFFALLQDNCFTKVRHNLEGSSCIINVEFYNQDNDLLDNYTFNTNEFIC